MRDRRFEAAKIVLFATLAAMSYGVIHDQITAHLCVEYFTIAHPEIFPTEAPFLLAWGWGIIATWWVGLTLGVCLAATARMGQANKLRLSELQRPILLVMVWSALAAFLAGACGAILVATGVTEVPWGWEAFIPTDRHVAFSAVAWAHAASYAAGALGGLLVIGHTLWRRKYQQLGRDKSID